MWIHFFIVINLILREMSPLIHVDVDPLLSLNVVVDPHLTLNRFLVLPVAESPKAKRWESPRGLPHRGKQSCFIIRTSHSKGSLRGERKVRR